MIQTERLTIRTLRFGEGEKIARYFEANREFLQPYYPTFTPDDFNPKVWEALVPRIQVDVESGHAARMCLFLGEEIIGVANITGIVGFPRYGAVLGYSLCEARQGQGYMTEALGDLVPYAFERFHLHRLEANYMPRNERSGRVLARLGFEKEGLARNYLLINGKWEDHVLTAKIKHDSHP